MFPLPISTWIASISLILALIGFAYGRHEHSNYVEFKQKVESLAKEQEIKNESIKKQHELVNKGITDAYEAKLSALRNYYKPSGVWNASSSKVSGISATPSSADVITAYNLLAGQCAQTTAQAIALQDWINENIGIK